MAEVSIGPSIQSRAADDSGLSQQAFKHVPAARPSATRSVGSSVLGRDGIFSIGVGRSQLARRLSSPPLECMSECAHLMKAKQPRNLGYMHLAVVEVTNR